MASQGLEGDISSTPWEGGLHESHGLHNGGVKIAQDGSDGLHGSHSLIAQCDDGNSNADSQLVPLVCSSIFFCSTNQLPASHLITPMQADGFSGEHAYGVSQFRNQSCKPELNYASWERCDGEFGLPV
jgi:hypothetical protein